MKVIGYVVLAHRTGGRFPLAYVGLKRAADVLSNGGPTGTIYPTRAAAQRALVQARKRWTPTLAAEETQKWTVIALQRSER